MDAFEENDDNGSVEDSCDSELINTEKYAEVHNNFMEFHLLESGREDPLTWVVIDHHENYVDEVVADEGRTNYAEEQSPNPRSEEGHECHRAEEGRNDHVKIAEIEQLQKHYWE